LATLLQKVYKGWIRRQKFLRLRNAQIVFASSWRCHHARQRYLNIRNAAIVLCSYARGWKARKQLRELKHRQKCVWAVSVIYKYYAGYLVRREYRSKFRIVAGPKIVKFLLNALRYRFLMKLSKELPSMSPIDSSWPRSSVLYKSASEQLRVLYHKTRCRRYRNKCDPAKRKILNEKVKASELFKDKKANYVRSISHPFIGDYVNLQQNVKWKKTASDTRDQDLVFADIVMKVNRRNGKMVHHLCVLSKNAVLVLDQRTLAIKYRLPVAEIEKISLSPYNDQLVIFHIKKPQENGDILTKKGDFVLCSEHVIEIVVKTVLLIEMHTGRQAEVYIGTHMKTLMKTQMVDVSFKNGFPDVPPGTVKITRKANKMDVLQL
jgi:myosin-1